MSRRRFIFLDRDGTIIVERHYLADPDGVELIRGASEGLLKMRQLGFGLIVVTNQSAVGRGVVTLPVLESIHRRMQYLLSERGVVLDGIFFCPHTPDDDCNCRKPLTGLIQQAHQSFDFDIAKCFVIGDKSCDIGLARNSGAHAILTRTGYGIKYNPDDQFTPDYVVEDLSAAADYIEREM